MDVNLLMVSFLFGMVGMGWFMYGRKTERWIPRIAGAGLMIVPYFIPNLLMMTLICSGLAAAPCFVREN